MLGYRDKHSMQGMPALTIPHRINELFGSSHIMSNMC